MMARRASVLSGRSVWQRALFALACAYPAGCADSQVVYDPPDAIDEWPAHRPDFAVPAGGLGYVSDSLSDQVSVLDLAAGHTLANVTVGIDPIGLDGPHHLAIDPAHGRLFVALSYPPPVIPSGPHAGHGSSTEPGRVLELDQHDFHEYARTTVDPNPGDIVLTPDGQSLIVTHFNLLQAMRVAAMQGTRDEMLSKLYVLDARSGDLHRKASFNVCVMAHGVAVSADSTRAYVACNGEDMLAVVHLDDPNHAVDPYYLGPDHGLGATTVYGPYAVLLTADGQYAVVSDINVSTPRVQFFNLATMQFDNAKTVSAPGPVFFGAESADGMYLYFPTQGVGNGVLRIRRSDNVSDFFPVARNVCLAPHEISRGPDGRFYLVCEGDHMQPSAVFVFDTTSMAVGDRYDVGVYPDRVVFAPGNSR